MKADGSLITVPARVLTPPEITYSNKAVKLDQSRAWNSMGQTLRVPATITRWSCLVVGLPGKASWCGFGGLKYVGETISAFHRVRKSMEMQVKTPLQGKRVELSGIDDMRLEQELAGAAKALDFLYIILPDKTPVYDRIKHLCDVKHGLINACCIGPTLKKNQDKYFRNEALKINAKCGGQNQAVIPARLHLIAQDKTMVVGIDVTHPSPGSSELAPSIAGMVASINKNMGQWPSLCKVQTRSRQEMVAGLEDMLKSRLLLWKNKGRHAYFPENIIVFRDGVSEGQYQLVKEKELSLLRKACDEVYLAVKQSRPRITIVVVTKRHHKRFYPTRLENADNSSNCMAGTVVDRSITEARSWNFFIMPHSALKVTAKPTYYFVVHDEIFRTNHRGSTLGAADTLENVTQSLSYVSARSTKPASICAPVDYANLVRERARCYLSSFFDPSAVPTVVCPRAAVRRRRNAVSSSRRR